MKKLSVFLCLVLILYSCSKKDKGNPAGEAERTTLTIDSSYALPGDPLKIKLNRKITQAEVIINLGTVQTKAYAGNDSEYVFFLPVLMPGKTPVTIPSITNSNSLTLTVRDYAAIADPQIVINEFVSKRNSCIDSLAKSIAGSSYQTSPQTALIISQLKEEWDDQFAKLQVNDKLLLAYILKKIMPQPSDFSFTLRQSNNILAKEQGLIDAGEKLVSLANKFVILKIACVVQIPFILGSLYSLITAPNPISAIILAGSIITFIILREAVIRQAERVGELPGILESIFSTNVKRVMANEFNNNTEKTIALDVLFRNLKSSDQTIQQNISKAFTSDNELQTEDREVEKLYTKAKQYTSKLKAPYNPYTATIGTYPQVTSTQPGTGSEVIIKGVSDNRISYTSSLTNGNRMIKITSTSTQEFNFDINVAVKRPLDGVEFVKSIPCVFKPEIDSTDYYKSLVLGNWTVNWYDVVSDKFLQEDRIEVKPNGIATRYESRYASGLVEQYSITYPWSVTKSNGNYIMRINTHSGRITPTQLQFTQIGLYKTITQKM
ncbi:hypothetical protein WG954_05865 [Lacibacter sp. H375]|uniref:hypothetical protein n=1 Tax=Lacibacter sp. H375 TaxID=3133424 RepID=UPI0030C382DD